MNVREHRRLVTEEFEKRGRALASNLGFASELGALSEDKQLLETTMRGALRNPDVAYVVIHGGTGASWPTAAGRSPSRRSSKRWRPAARYRAASSGPASDSSSSCLRSSPSKRRRPTRP